MRVTAKLGFLLSAMKGMVEGEIQRVLKESWAEPRRRPSRPCNAGARYSGSGPTPTGSAMNHYENDDRRNDDASFSDQAERFSRKLSDSAQQVWLAGLGALGRAQAEGSRFFDGLVKEGEAWEARRRERNGDQGPGWRDNVETSLDEARESLRHLEQGGEGLR